MNTTLRGGRVEPPRLPTGEIVIRTPPQLEASATSGGALINALPMLGSLGSILVVATTAGSAPDAQRRSFFAAGMFLVATVGFLVVQIDRQRRQRTEAVNGPRTAYLRYLGTVRRTARDAASQQRAALLWHGPDPRSLPALAQERSRVWSHAVTDAEFLQVRYGLCSRPLSLDLVAPDLTDLDRVDPSAASALQRLLSVHRVQPGLPAVADLRALDRIEVCGPEEVARSLARAMVCSAATFQAPEQLVIAVLASETSLAQWDWVKWLPHALSPHVSDAIGPRRMVATRLADLAALLPRDAADGHLLLVVDGVPLPAGSHVFSPDRPHGLTVLELPSRWHALEDGPRLRLLVEEDVTTRDGRPAIRALRVGEAPSRAVGDQCDLATAEALARRLAPLPVVATVGVAELVDGVEIGSPGGFMDLLGLGDVRRYEPVSVWRSRTATDRLRVPIGLDDAGGPIHLDLKEAAQHGMGPHGLVIGATGSGKSEFLRTLVLGLAMTHSPERLNMVLVDFKGGATFAGMSAMPHVSAVITNLESELALVDRMQDALAGEMVRRQQLLRDAGSYASVRDYEQARAAGEALTPLPSLLVAVDEFSEMLSAKPEFIDLFVAIGRLGRSLGLHLLLASQRLEEGRLRGLESHLSYRVGLRTFSAQESRTVLGVPDAYELLPRPGLGFLKPDQSTLLRFTAAYVSGPPGGDRPRVVPSDDPGRAPMILPWTIAEVPACTAAEPTNEPEPVPGPAPEQESLLDVAVARMAGQGPAAHPVWLPPLDLPTTLDEVMPDLTPDPRLGLVSQQWRALARLTVPLGAVDRPREQRRDTFTVNLSGAGGHLAVVGGPRSGKSTLLRTLVTSLSLTTTPLESQFFVLDFGGGAFAPMHALPHLAGMAVRSEPDVVRRIVAQVSGIVDRREAYFRDQGIESIETYRMRREQGRADDGYGDVFLVVDGWSTLRADFDDLELALQQLASRGLTYGLHVVTASSRWADYRAATRDLIGTRLELRLGDPLDSEIDRRLAAAVPPGRPGRGLVPDGLHILTALPRIDGHSDGATLGDGVATTVRLISEAWHGPMGPKLRLLPELLTTVDLLHQPGPATSGRRLLLGVDETDLAPVGLDADAEPHWLIFGEGRSGKSGALRGYLHEVMRTRSPRQAQIIVVDYRRSLLGEVPEDYLLDYLTSAAPATSALADLASYLQGRIPGPDVTPEQLRSRSWWTGAEVFVVVDDYDLVATTQSSPVQVLQPLLAHARDTGLHLVVARRSGGASRALYEPVVQCLRDLAAPGLVLAGSPDEGALIGNVRPGPAPPGRGRLVTRDRGVEVVQLAWREPSLSVTPP
ncbi:MAG TPA: type VII secretion protein EccCa [Nocardioides sp.]|nr:type VII secretion protein EccCa [Nocardioides sp.]